MEKKVYLSLGTNLGYKGENLDEARRLIQEGGAEIIGESFVEETPAWGIEDQPSFLNQVLLVKFEGSPYELLDLCNQVESKMGRAMPGTESYVKWGPRLIDVDILMFGGAEIEDDRLIVPHHTITKDYIIRMISDIEERLNES